MFVTVELSVGMYNLMSVIKVQVDIDKCFLLRSSPIITRKSFNCESVQCCHRKTSMSMKFSVQLASEILRICSPRMRSSFIKNKAECSIKKT